MDRFQKEKIITGKELENKKLNEEEIKNVIKIEDAGETIFGNVKYKIKQWIDVKRQLIFIDSFTFLSTALGNLVKDFIKMKKKNNYY